ncbi:unnamed protein product, partial [Notodromas monacha]
FSDQVEKNAKKNKAANEKTPLLKSEGKSGTKTLVRGFGRTHVSIFKILAGLAIGVLAKASILSVISDCISFTSPILLQMLIEFTYSDDPMWKGFLYATLIPISVAIYSVLLHGFFKMALCAGMRVKTCVIAALYRKALKMSNATRRQSTLGEIVNLMAVDAQRIMETTFVVDLVWTMPLVLGLTTTFLWLVMGPSALAGLLLLIALIPVNTLIAQKSRKFQMAQMKLKDERLKLMTEILNGIKVLKLYAWEESFGDQVRKIRAKEIEILRKDAFLNAINNFVWICAPYMVSLVTFATFVLSDDENVLDATTAFVSIALFNILRFPMALVPFLVASFVQASVSVKRVEKFLNSEEIDPNATQRLLDDEKVEYPIKVSQASFSWCVDEAAVLTDIDVEIPKGKLTAIVGPVGCGKSSLLSAFLGEMDRLTGSAKIYGSTGYVAQEAWIRNMSLKENILCGNKFKRTKYQQVVFAAALQPDIDILIAGDETEIGEKGVNLSGGQKQRVSLARATYAEKDVYLFDDPLSAVDAHVGKHIFEYIIGPKGLLASKTRVLVTHGVSHLPSTDFIIVMANGKISEMGTYEELMDKRGAFADYILQYLSTVDEIDEIEDPEAIGELKEIQKVLEKKLGKEVVQRRISETRSQMSTSFSGDFKSFQKDSSYEAKPRKLGRKSDTKTKRVTFTDSMSSSFSEMSQQKKPSRKKKPLPAAGGTLIEDEFAESGRVKGEVFVRYFRAMGWTLVLCTIVAYIASQSCSVLANVFLSEWSNSNENLNSTSGAYERSTNMYYLAMYGGIGAGQGVFIIIGAILMALGSLRASKKMHDEMLSNILQSPMSFFDTTPIGRINNRFGKDLDTMDLAIPRSVISALNNFLLVFATLAVNGATTPWFLLAVTPVAILYFFIQRFYAATSRQLKRLSSVTQSPMYSHFGESVMGGPTIRAFRLQDDFIAESEQKVDTHQRCFYPSMNSNRWLAIRLELIGAVLVFFASIFAVLGRDTLSGGLVGLSVTYAMGVGIVGRTGAGKSSLTLALFRIIEPTHGSIVIDGINTKNVGLADLRSRITIIPQDPVLFSGSLRMNLDPFMTNDDATLWSSLEHAHLKSFVKSLPNGLDHEVSEGGANLSVGQRQLVCLARALLRKTKILVLDEATAAVDLETDEFIQNAIRTEFAGCTVITIAHRINTIMDSDRVMVLSNGSIEEFDNPEKLLENPDSLFTQLARDAGLLNSSASAIQNASPEST